MGLGARVGQQVRVKARRQQGLRATVAQRTAKAPSGGGRRASNAPSAGAERQRALGTFAVAGGRATKPQGADDESMALRPPSVRPVSLRESRADLLSCLALEPTVSRSVALVR